MCACSPLPSWRLYAMTDRSLLELDAWVLPKHESLHWTGAVINFTSKTIVFADSMGSSNPVFCHRLWCLLEVASQVFRGHSFDFSGWRWGSLGLLGPQQPNAYDCGIFATVLLVHCHHLHCAARHQHRYRHRCAANPPPSLLPLPLLYHGSSTHCRYRLLLVGALADPQSEAPRRSRLDPG